MDKKLNLNKEVIATLNDDSMNRVKGGEAISLNMWHPGCFSAPHNIGEDSYCICKENASVGLHV